LYARTDNRMADSVSEYESVRLENIARNEEFLRSIGLHEAKLAIRLAAEKTDSPPAADVLPRGKKRRGSTSPAQHPEKRRSGRLNPKEGDALVQLDTSILGMSTSITIRIITINAHQFERNYSKKEEKVYIQILILSLIINRNQIKWWIVK
jgi:hypothetical protein